MPIYPEWSFKTPKSNEFALLIALFLDLIVVVVALVAENHFMVIVSLTVILGLYFYYQECQKVVEYCLNNQEFIRLEDDCIRYNLYPHGEGCLKYEWLTYVYPSPYPRTGSHHYADSLVLEYRPPNHSSLILPSIVLDLYRMKCERGFTQCHSDIVIAELERTCGRKLFV